MDTSEMHSDDFENGFFNRVLRFLKKKNQKTSTEQSITATNVEGSIFQVGGDFNINVNTSKELLEELLKGKEQGNETFIMLLEEKAQECQKFLIQGEAKNVRTICESLCIATFEGCPETLRNRFKYYRYLLSIIDNESNEVQEKCKIVLKGEYFDRAERISTWIGALDQISYNDLKTCAKEDQVCVLTQIFNSGLSSVITNMYDDLTTEEKECIPEFYKYYVGLSLFNDQRFKESASILRQVYESNYYEGIVKNTSIIIFSHIAKLQYITKDLSQGFGTKEGLEEAFEEYKKLKDKGEYAEAIKGHETLMASVELQTVLNLNREEFWIMYSKYPIQIQKDPMVLNLLGTYYELKQDFQNVYDIYSQLDWKHEDLFLFKLIYSKFIGADYNGIINLYEEADESAKSSRVRGLWLCAISELHPERFENEFETAILSIGDNFEDLFAITLSLKNEERTLFEKYVYPNVETLMNDIIKSTDNVKVGYAGLLIQYGHGDDALNLLENIVHSGIIDDQLGMEFYKNLYWYKSWDESNELISWDDLFQSVDANAKTVKESLSDWFINNDIVKANFLTIKINCLYERGKIIDSIDKSKELYDITKDESVAANIISLLSQRRNSSKADYRKYADLLQNSNDLRCLMASAVGYEEVEDYEKAGFQAYKALYKLNGLDDYDVFDSCFVLHNRMMAYHKGDIYEKERVEGSVVVTLKECICGYDVSKVPSVLTICLDSEDFIADYSDNGRNKSIGIEHYGPKDSLYIWLSGKKIGDQVTIEGKKYSLVEILDRYFYVSRYVFSKIIDSKGRSNIPVKAIKTTDIDSMKNELVSFLNSEEISSAREGRKNLLDMYHHIENEMGIPIESVNSCDYMEYLEVVRDLLFVEDQALYAGETKVYEGYEGKYVLTLPSLAVIFIMSCEKLFDSMKDKLLIPESLKSFIREQISKNTDTEKISPGKLITTKDGNMIMLQKDSDIVDLWRRIYAFCSTITSVEVNDEERSVFSLVADVDAEKLFSKMRYDDCQLDAFILAKKNDSVLIMDDLFFRRLAEYSGIHTTNSMFVLYKDKSDEVYDIANKLSKTNYIMTPILYKDAKSGEEFWNNLLHGKIKRAVYGQQFRLIYERIQQMINTYGIGNDIGMSTVVETMD